MKTFFVNEFPGINDDERITACFAEAKRQKNSTVVFRGRDFVISRAIEVGSDMTILVDDCTIKQADGAFDNVFRGANIKIDSEKPFGDAQDVAPLENVKIIGRGKAVIEGCDKNRRGFHTVLEQEQDMTGDFWGWRTYQMMFCNAKNLEIAGLTFVKTRCWCITIDLSSDVYVHDLSIFSTIKNGDGVHFLSGCHDILVERIKGVTSDDTVAVQSGLLWFEFPFRNYLYPFTP
ncbi:MAG TPA: glycosyl hydrolase family 28 protein, partial [Clostridiales bacterium]|nr:glycosyl hydrolase family 28 protein [Clostridiales bacterium]